MFNNLQSNLLSVFSGLGKETVLTAEKIDKAIGDIRYNLLEADVAVSVADAFIENVQKQADGEKILKKVSPVDAFTKIVYDELVKFLDDENSELKLSGGNAPYFVMMVGLQGSGKTTTTGKISNYLKTKESKKVLMASLDNVRPGAKQQLEILGQNAGIETLEIIDGELPIDTAKRAQKYAKQNEFDVVFLDTAGRMHIDNALMDDVSLIKNYINPKEILFVADAMYGQDTVNIAKSFNDALEITGVVLTRVDGDARGGAALSVKHVTGKPIKFMGVGEKFTEIEKFDPKRIADRIMDKGDVISLVEKAQEAFDEKEAEKLEKRMASGVFDLNDMRAQFVQMNKMGGLGAIAGMIPGMGKMKEALNNPAIQDGMIKRQIAIIDSMTKGERKNPDILHASRKKRIAAGSGTQVSEINKLVKQYLTMKKMMKKVNSGKGMPQMPPGMNFPKGMF